MDQSISSIRSQAGEIINYVLFSRDTTQEREMEIRARWADERLRLSINGMVDGLTLWDAHLSPAADVAEFVCSEANPSALLILGKDREEVVGNTVRKLMSGVQDYDLHELFLRVHARGKPCILEHLRFVTGDTRVTLTIHVWGVGTGVACHLRDVTQQLELETQLRQAQKLEAVGSLAAGIAHEINTPIQFVSDNIRFLADSFSSIMEVVEQHRLCREKMVPVFGELDEIIQLRELDRRVDVDYLKTEIPLAVEQSLDGVRRVSTIVRAMKDFSHINEREMVLADINQMLDTTLTVARNELKYVADVAKDFSTDIPQVECFRNDLNQVFLNLMINAAHAIADVVGDGTSGRGTITVRTRREGEDVVVAISDTGSGIPVGVRDRVFDPFFTTKEVGKGSGQGLAIARSIVVEKHKGAVTFDTEVGKGTTFYVRLPIIRKEVVHADA
jgi:signal transduction histidine kinase